MIKLADRFGLSDVGLKKKCRRYDIPVPPRGYWARKQAGQNPAKTPLPKGVPLDTIIIIYRNPMRDNALRPKPAIPSIKMREIKKELSQSAQSKILHPLVEVSREALQNCPVNMHGVLIKPDGLFLDLEVSPGSLERAVSIMDRVIKTLEGLGHQVAVNQVGTIAQISGVSIAFSLFEELKRRLIEPYEHNLDGDYRFGHSLYSDHRVPTGILCLTIHPPSLTNSRKNWRDTESKRLEEHLGSFIKVLFSIAARQEREAIPHAERFTTDKIR